MRVVKWVVFVIVILIAAAAVALLTVDVNRFKPQIVAAVENATGRKLEIAENMKLSFFPLGVSVKKVSFGNATWGTRPQMATVGEFTAQVDLLALLDRKIKVDRLVMSDVDVLLEKNRQGQANWEFGPATAAPAAPAAPARQKAESGGMEMNGIPVITDVQLKNVKLAYRDAQSGAKNDLLLRQLSVRQGKDGGLAVRLGADVDGNEIAAEGVLGSIAELMAPSRPWPVKLAVTVPGATLNIDGTIAQPMQAKGIALRTITEVPDLATVASKFGGSAPAVPLQLALVVKDKGPQDYVLSDIAGKIADSDLSGSGEIRLGGARPSVSFDLSSKSFNVIPLIGGKAAPAKSAGATSGAPAGQPAPAAPAQGAPANGRLFSDDPLPLDGLNAVDAAVSFKAGLFKAPMVEARNLTLAATLRDGALSVKPFSADAAGGHADGSATLDAKAKALAVKLDASKVDLGGYLKQAGITDIISNGAPTDLAVDVTGTGASLHQIMAGLDGKVILKVGEGELKEDYMKSFLPRLADAAGFLNKATAKTKLYCVVSGLDIRKGVVTPKALLAETGRISLAGQGEVNLGTEQISMLVVPSSRDISLSAALPPVRIRGPLTDPGYSADPAALAKSVIGTAAGVAALGPLAILSPVLGKKSGGDDSQTACAKAVALAEGKPVPASPNGTTTQKQGNQQPQSPADELKDLGKQLKGLFKR